MDFPCDFKSEEDYASSAGNHARQAGYLFAEGASHGSNPGKRPVGNGFFVLKKRALVSMRRSL